MIATLERRPRLAANPLTTMATRLAKRLAALGQPSTPSTLDKALRQLLEGQDELSRQLRTAMQIHLVNVSNERSGIESGKAGAETDLVSTEDAAHLMGCSRPYVAMLIDAKKLEGAVVSKGGHRKVPKTSVLRWIEENEAIKDKDYRKAAAAAGMYSVPEEAYVESKPRKRQSAH